jgi:hypothetical protein
MYAGFSICRATPAAVPACLGGAMRTIGTEIYAAVRAGKLAQPFGAAMIKRACPGYADQTYTDFPSKHRVGNPSGVTELFVRVSRGRYRLNLKEQESGKPKRRDPTELLKTTK